MTDKKYDMEHGIWNSFIKDKAFQNDVYCQHLYAALCNNDFVYGDMLEVVKGEYWGCSWRYAGEIVAEIREEGDYLDWYCSGTGNGLGNGDEEGVKGYVGEGVVTEEIEQDLNTLGWIVVPYKEDE